ncbi:unnamed protein product [Adineta steineri]|uniref:Purple acid phosphatase n=1 Tax=Adineta steineri TaxID=433720 RepID=A0A819P5Y7_9BILA|nr:unnamed protein product [Adineta steineri]
MTVRSLVRAGYDDIASFNDLQSREFDILLCYLAYVHELHPAAIFTNSQTIKNLLQMELTSYFLCWFVIITLINAKPLNQVEESPLRMIFRRVDVNANEELDVYELQKYFHNIEPEDAMPDINHIVRRMKRTMKLEINEQKQPFTISWQQFRKTYAELDTVTARNAPQQIHLSLLADGSWSTMIVIWIVKGSESKHEPSSLVRYGTISGNYTHMQAATNRTYDVGIGGWKGTIFEAWMTELEQCQIYYYRVGNANSWSDESSFKTDCSNASTHIFAVMGDMGTIIPAGFLVTKQIKEDHQITPFSSVVHVGDISYAGTGSTDEISEVWDAWGRQVEPISSIVPYMTNVGNHEAYYNYTVYRNRFRMPGPESAGLDNFWFSFNIGPVHWVSLSSQHDYSKSSVQYAWLINDLAKANENRAQQPFVIVVTHRPLLCSDASELDQHLPTSPLFETVYPLFVKYQVQLVITGHMHVYERVFYDNTTTIVNNTYANVNSPVIIVQGTGGTFDNDKWVEPQPWWSISRMLAYGYGRVTVSVDKMQKRLQYEYLLEHDRSTYDQFSIVI